MTSRSERNTNTELKRGIHPVRNAIYMLHGEHRYLNTLTDIEGKKYLGGKGWNLHKLQEYGFNVPPAFVIPVKNRYGTHPNEIQNILRTTDKLEEQAGKTFGDPENSLFVSVRSGAPISMPGLLDTTLNVGITSNTISVLEQMVGEINAWKSYYALLHHLCSIEESEPLPPMLETDDIDELKRLVEQLNEPRFESPQVQVLTAIKGVYKSLWSERAIDYLETHYSKTPDEVGTGITVMEMKFGNGTNANAGSGVLFTYDSVFDCANPQITFVRNVQGDHVVGDTKTTQGSYEILPEEVQEEMRELVAKLQQKFLKTQDVEFVYDGEQVYLLQTRDAFMPAPAVFRFLMKGIEDGRFNTEAEVMRHITTQELYSLFHPSLDQKALENAKRRNLIVGYGEPIGLGNATGELIASVEDATSPDKKYILYIEDAGRIETLQLPKSVVGIIVRSVSNASHAARHLEALHKPVIGGFSPDESLLSPVYTIDTESKAVIRGDIAREKEATVLNSDEMDIAKKWLRLKLANPWRFAQVSDRDSELEYQSFHDELFFNAFASASKYTSLKGKEVAVFNAIFPPQWRIDYELLRPDIYEGFLLEKMHKILEKNDDVTLRTGHFPAIEGKSPYAYLRNFDEVREFLYNPNFERFHYGWYGTFLDHPDLKELILGSIPKDKLSRDLDIKAQHCAFTVTVGDNGEVVISLIPGTANLRDLEDPSNVSRLITAHIPPRSLNHTESIMRGVTFGHDFEQNEDLKESALQFFTNVQQTLDFMWDQGLAARLAVAQDVLPRKSGNRTLVLEGQSRIDAKGNNSWIKFYGIKADRITSEK